MTQPRHFSMIRSFHLADLFTLGNAFFGVASIFCVMDYLQSGALWHLSCAMACIPVALVFDVLDGRIARWRQQQSTLGRELDSLADIISFGVAPAAIAYGVGCQGILDRIVLLYFVVCGVSRLARFNITAESLSAGDPAGKVRYFEGTPIPTSLLLVGILAWAAWQGRIGPDLLWGATQLGSFTLHPVVLLYFLSGSAMISKTLRIPKL